MHWFTVLLIVGIALYIIVPKLRQVPMEKAVVAIREGAPYVDVRTIHEFRQQSLPGSVNFPLSQLEQHLQESDISKEDPILLFCLSGTRSATAERRLKSMGYNNAMNLGSFHRARKAHLLSKAKPEQ